MDYEAFDSSGTDDDLPPSHQNRVHRGPHVGGNARPVSSVPYPRLHNDMKSQIYHLEQEAYRAVLLAFKAQSDTTITWEKTSLMAELRKELNISEDEHKALLARVDADDNLRRIREWRQSGGLQPGLHNTSQPVHDPLPSPTISASRKRQKTSQSVPALSLHPSNALYPQTVFSPIQPSLSAAKRGALPGPKSRKSKSSQTLVSTPSMKSTPYPSTVTSGRGQITDQMSSGVLVENEITEDAPYDPSLIGRKVKTRWPDDNNFYEAVITDYKDGRYALVYDVNTSKQTWEWVNLSEFSPEDIIWDGEDPGISRSGGKVRSANATRMSVAHSVTVPGMGRGVGNIKNLPKRDLPSIQNGIAKKASDNVEILRTDTLIKEVEKIFEANRSDPVEIQKAKKTLKDHEQALVDAIARLSEAYDSKTDGGEKAVDREESLKKPIDGEEGRGGGGSDGDQTAAR